MYHWDDGTVGYYVKDLNEIFPVKCASVRAAGQTYLWDCSEREEYPYALCEREESSSETNTSQNEAARRPGIELPLPSNSTVQLPHTVCPSDHWTHEFLACDVQSACWQQDSYRPWSGGKTRGGMTSPCQFPFSEMFTCTSGMVHVPYSLVCDHGQDCLDSSDEDFCVHPSCTETWQFKCFNEEVNVCFLRSFLNVPATFRGYLRDRSVSIHCA